MQNLDQDKRRRDERIDTELPVDLGAAKGLARNVSASGMYFETDTSYAVGGEIEFSVDLDTPGGKMVLKCRGEIVRVSAHEGKTGVAVKIINSTMEPGK